MRGTGLAALALALAPASLAAHQGSDDAVLSIREGGREIGREELSIRPGRGPDGRTAGSTISGHARYPAFGPEVELAGVVELNTAGRPTVLQLEYRGPGGEERFLAAHRGRRATVHRFSGGSQGAREYPARGFPIFLVDSSYAFYLALAPAASDAGAAVSAIYPREGRTAQLTVTAVSGDPRREIRFRGAVTGSLWLDAEGRFLRLELPDRGIVVLRLDD